MRCAGKALAAIRLAEHPELLAATHREHREKTGGSCTPVLPPGLRPKL